MNIIAVFSPEKAQILLCRRKNPPYQGLLNFVGGKVAHGEDGLHAAYRELYEETGISPSDIQLHHLMDFIYYAEDTLLEVYYGYLAHPVSLKEEVNALLWLDTDQNYADTTVFAGYGNLGHIISLIQMYETQHRTIP